MNMFHSIPGVPRGKMERFAGRLFGNVSGTLTGCLGSCGTLAPA